jgi:hypothetical protein
MERSVPRRSTANSAEKLRAPSVSLPTFTLAHVFEEVTTWLTTGRSRFRKLLESQNLPPPECSPLDALLPATGVP